MSDYVAVVTTLETRDKARDLARALVEEGLAACAQISEIESVFTWDGKVQDEREFRILFKTHASRREAVEEAIRSRHGYDVPALFSLPMTHVDRAFGSWIDECVTGHR